MCNHPDREAAMTVLKEPDDQGPGIWCDPCLAPLVEALNNGGVPTIASCCGHDHFPGNIMLADGRQLYLLPDTESADALAGHFHDLKGCPSGRECAACEGRVPASDAETRTIEVLHEALLREAFGRHYDAIMGSPSAQRMVRDADSSAGRQARRLATALAAAGVLATPAPDTAAVEALARLTSDLRAVVAKVDRSWGGAAMVVRDSVAHLLGDRCTNEFCEHDHVAIRAALAPRATTEGSETDG